MFAVQLLFSEQHNHVFKVLNERFKYRNLEELDLLSAFCCYMLYYFVTCRKKQVHRHTVTKFLGTIFLSLEEIQLQKGSLKRW